MILKVFCIGNSTPPVKMDYYKIIPKVANTLHALLTKTTQNLKSLLS